MATGRFRRRRVGRHRSLTRSAPIGLFGGLHARFGFFSVDDGAGSRSRSAGRGFQAGCLSGAAPRRPDLALSVPDFPYSPGSFPARAPHRHSRVPERPSATHVGRSACHGLATGRLSRRLPTCSRHRCVRTRRRRTGRDVARLDRYFRTSDACASTKRAIIRSRSSLSAGVALHTCRRCIPRSCVEPLPESHELLA